MISLPVKNADFFPISRCRLILGARIGVLRPFLRKLRFTGFVYLPSFYHPNASLPS